MAKINYSEIVFNEGGSGSNVIKRFSLKNNGDEAIVRICHDDLNSLDIGVVHQIGEGKMYREINCLRTPQQSTDVCPFCSAGIKTTQLIYIHLVEYSTNADGSISATPKVWGRGISWASKLKDLINEYGPLTQCLFKIKRSGAAGDTNTQYNLMFCNPQVYNTSRYPMDAVATFNGYSAFDAQVTTRSFEDMQYYVQYGQFPANNNQNATPSNNVVQNTFNPTTAPTNSNPQFTGYAPQNIPNQQFTGYSPQPTQQAAPSTTAPAVNPQQYSTYAQSPTTPPQMNQAQADTPPWEAPTTPAAGITPPRRFS